MAFKGFTKESILFLKELGLNNNKNWFNKNRSLYERYLLEPLRQLTDELGDVIRQIDNNIETTPQINRTISKIYRDTRFSKDKSPFRTDLWISFKRPFKIWGNVPEFYFYFTPEEYQYGMGYYSASSKNMEMFRQFISTCPDRFKEIVDYYNSQNIFTLVGDPYKRFIPNQHPEDFQKWFQKRNLCLSCIKKIDKIFFSKTLKEELEQGFIFNANFYHFLLQSINKNNI